MTLYSLVVALYMLRQGLIMEYVHIRHIFILYEAQSMRSSLKRRCCTWQSRYGVMPSKFDFSNLGQTIYARKNSPSPHKKT